MKKLSDDADDELGVELTQKKESQRLEKKSIG